MNALLGINPKEVIGRVLRYEEKESTCQIILEDTYMDEKVYAMKAAYQEQLPTPGSWVRLFLDPSGSCVTQWVVLQPSLVWDSHHPWADKTRRRRLRKRFDLLQAIRKFFLERQYIEVDTPVCVASPGLEPYLEPFTTLLDAGTWKTRAFLPYSPEYGMKKLLAMGFCRIFQFAHAFRNGEWSRWHEPEFLMLEWYRAPGTYDTLMKEIESFMMVLCPDGKLEYQDKVIDLSPPWPRWRYADLLEQHTGLSLEMFTDVERVRARFLKSGHHVPKCEDPETLIQWAFMTFVEPNLPAHRPVFVIDYPPSMSALARLNEDQTAAERFEWYMAGLELANGCTELRESNEHTMRFAMETQARIRCGYTPVPQDEQFLFAVRWGLPPAAGVALGVDRLIAILLNARSLEEVVPFPSATRFSKEMNEPLDTSGF